MNLYSIETPCCSFDAGAMFGVVPKSIWQKSVTPDENNLVKSSMRCLLVVEGDRKILIDTGVGNKVNEKTKQNFHMEDTLSLKELLHEKGFLPEDITDVVFTHLHFDHVGGAVVFGENKELQPLFPNAKHWVSKQQWERALNSNPREAASFLPENYMSLHEAGLLYFIDSNTEMTPFISVRLFDGHTEGQIIPFIKYSERTLVFMADFIPTAYNLPLPYVPAYDTKPLDSMAEKEAFLKEAQEKGYVLFFEHDYEHECITVEETPKGIRKGKTFSLEEFVRKN